MSCALHSEPLHAGIVAQAPWIVQGLPLSPRVLPVRGCLTACLPEFDRKWMPARSTGLPAGDDGRRRNSPASASAPDP